MKIDDIIAEEKLVEKIGEIYQLPYFQRMKKEEDSEKLIEEFRAFRNEVEIEILRKGLHNKNYIYKKNSL